MTTPMGMKKDKSKIKTKKAKVKPKKKSASYWKDKCDTLWSDIIRQVGHCEYCLIVGIKGEKRGWLNLDAHHLIGKTGIRTKYRHNLSNGICLCSPCHEFDPVCSAHGNNGATENFLKWLKVERNGQWVWLMEHKDDKSGQGEKPDYEAKYKELSEMLPS